MSSGPHYILEPYISAFIGTSTAPHLSFATLLDDVIMYFNVLSCYINHKILIDFDLTNCPGVFAFWEGAYITGLEHARKLKLSGNKL